jgi:hypothetical protein
MANRIGRMYNRFMNNISSTTICKYFGLLDKNLDIQLTSKDNYFLLHFNYTKKIKYISFRNLPEDINREIYSFLNPAYIHVTYKVLFGNNYPIDPPIWSLYSIDYKCTLSYNVNIPEYYNYIIQKHNNINDRDWSLAIDLEKDCLTLIVLLNHFHYFF